MSLSSLNQPSLVATLGAAAWAFLPSLEQRLVQQMPIFVPFQVVKVANFLAYWLNFLAVSRPGRLDGEIAEEMAKQKKQSASGQNNIIYNDDNKDLTPAQRRQRTLVAPSGWAFAIWGPIFLGEFALVTTQLFTPESHALEPLIRAFSGPYLVANIFQVLWTASFRAKYNEGIWLNKYISFAMLSGIALSLSKAHNVLITMKDILNGPWQSLLYVLPITLHFGWTTAASLVNLNGCIATETNVSAETLAWTGHLSVLLASLVGVGVTVTRQAPVYGAVIAWALTAVGDGLTQRLQSNNSDKKTNKKIVGLYGARFQQILSRVGAGINLVTSLVIAIMGAHSLWLGA